MALSDRDRAATERMPAWQCIGCGRIEAERPCVGICQDRRVDLVYAHDYDEALAQSTLMGKRMQALLALVRQLAHTVPREGEWEGNYRALQVRAQRTLQTLGDDEQSRPE